MIYKIVKTTKKQQAIGILILFCIATFLLRIQLTQSLFFGFLLWNMCLAIVPYIISEWLKKNKKSKKTILFSVFIWLLFLPNAPYLITDFIHLHHLKSTLIWYDIFMLFCFAFTGVLLAIISTHNIYMVIKYHFKQITYNKIIIPTAFLSGFGIYLGRFLRLNSWELFTNPLKIIQQISLSLTAKDAWFFTLGFGSFLCLLFFFFDTILRTQEKK